MITSESPGCPDEQRLAALIEGRLRADERDELEQHIDGCDDCRRLLSELVADETVPTQGESGTFDVAPGRRLGRYVVQRRLGAGGMGVVYAATDPELGRTVAIKLVLPDPGMDEARTEEAHSRLLREAQALAKLDHPNVVAIHDVGRMDGRVFIAMAYVEGGSLVDWLSQRTRPWPEVLACFLQAARGLAAAHDVGLVHRDFKPANVLLGADGIAQVVDFGLVRPAWSEPSHTDSDTSSPASAGLSVTRTGAVMGTPAYMAPEQFRGEVADARADQFAWCVALWEALYGRRPFPGRSLAQIYDAVITSRYAPVERSGVPRWIVQALRRGLAPSREDRWPSMHELIAALDRDPGRTQRRLFGAVALVGATAAAAWIGASVGEAPSPCQGGTARVAEVWGEPQRQAMGEAFASTGLAFADEVAGRVRPRLDARAEQWARMHDEACQAHQRGEQSGTMLDRRMACLERRRVELEALVQQLVRTDEGAAEVVRHAEAAAAALPDVQACADLVALEAGPSRPEDPAERERADAIASLVARAQTQEVLGDLDASLRLAETAVEQARALGHAPTLAEALAEHGQVLTMVRTGAEAEPVLMEAIETAAVGGHDVIEAFAWLELVWAVGGLELRTDEALVLAKAADVAVRRAGDPPELRGRYLDRLGSVMVVGGRYEQAKALLEQAVAVREQGLGPEHPEVAISMSNLANAMRELGDHEGALAMLRRAAAIEQQLGPRHPLVAGSYEGMAMVHYDLGHGEQALGYAQRALDIRQERLAAGHPDTLRARRSVAAALLWLHRNDEAAALLESMLSDHEHGAARLDDEQLGHLHSMLGGVYYMQDDVDRAAVHIELGLTLGERVHGADHPSIASRVANLAALEADREHWAEAAALYERVVRMRAASTSDDHPAVARARTSLAVAYRRLGRTPQAEALLVSVLGVLEGAPGEVASLARAELELARIRWEQGRRTEAIERAEHARKVLLDDGGPGDDLLREVQSWLAAPGSEPVPTPSSTEPSSR